MASLICHSLAWNGKQQKKERKEGGREGGKKEGRMDGRKEGRRRKKKAAGKILSHTRCRAMGMSFGYAVPSTKGYVGDFQCLS